MDEILQLLGERRSKIDLSLAALSQRFSLSQRICVVTSGGTRVRLCRDEGYSLDNFSTGRRGSCLAARLAEQGSPVLFLYRRDSIVPPFTELIHGFPFDFIEEYLYVLQLT